MTPPDTSEFLTAANAGLPLGRMRPAFGDDAYARFREAFDHATDAEEYGDGTEPVHPIPCYACGKISRLVCHVCCRNLCNGCHGSGNHTDPGGCEFDMPADPGV